MEVQDLNGIINNENKDSEIIALNIVIKDRNSKQLIVYHIDGFGDLEKYNAV